MSKERREEILLEFMADHRLALPPTIIYRNLLLQDRLVVSYSTIENYLEELVRQDLVARVEPKPLEERQVVEVPLDKEARCYYLITDEGVKQATD